MQKSKGTRLPSVIALISGKGGSGKSAVCIAMGYLLADLGLRVVLADADIATHGMSYFWAEHLQPDTIGLCDSWKGKSPSLIPLKNDSLDDRLVFVPSIGDLERVADVRLNEDTLIRNVPDLISQAGEHSFHFVILDCQAGFTSTVEAILPQCSSAIVVSEADPVSVWAINELRRQLVEADALPNNIFGLVNKVMQGEEHYYEATVDIVRRIHFLGQLPFDLDVRKAFFRREVPVDLDNPSPFVVQLSRVIGKLDSEIAKRVETKKGWRAMMATAMTRDRIDKLRGLQADIEKEFYQLVSRGRRLTMLMFLVSIIYLVTAALLYALDIIPLWALSVIIAVGVIPSVVTAIRTRIPSLRSRREAEREREIEKKRDLLRRITDELAEYEILERIEKS